MRSKPRIPGVVAAAIAIAIAVVAAGFICPALGFGKPEAPKSHCYGQAC